MTTFIFSGEQFEYMPLEEKVADGSDGAEVEFDTEVIEVVSTGRSVFAVLAERRDGGPVGARADEDFKDILRADFSVHIKAQAEHSGEGVDKEVEKLILMEFYRPFVVSEAHRQQADVLSNPAL